MTLEDRGTSQPPLSERPAPDGSDIRKLTAADVTVIASALARAFEDDPVMNWIMRDEEIIGRLERAFGFFLRNIWLREDQCYATTRLSGAALWLPPGKWHLSPLAQLRLLPGMASVVGRNLPRMMSVLNLIEKKHTKEPATLLGGCSGRAGASGTRVRRRPDAAGPVHVRRCPELRLPRILEGTQRSPLRTARLPCGRGGPPSQGRPADLADVARACLTLLLLLCASPAHAAGAVVWAVGDGADSNTHDDVIAALIEQRNPDAFLYLGDVSRAAPPESSRASTTPAMAV